MGEQRVVVTVAMISSLAILSCVLLYCRQQQQERRKQTKDILSCKDGGALQDQKPQQSFRRVLADNSRAPFLHLQTEENGNGLSHPYGEKIRELLKHPSFNYSFMLPGYQEPPGMESELVWVETRDELQALVKVLSSETEFAVDTEQHSFHSFRGFTALVQISTRKTDYLVDSIALHDSMNILGPVFANPSVCKVFHGADSDILWLQRDFHIYVVNMFDTAKACLILGKQQRSLSSLLQLYCGVTTNKAFQRADWRLRPLPTDMLQYARTDAHYLLYIAYRLCTELLQNISDETTQELGADEQRKNSGYFLERAVYRSNLNCLRLYEKDGASALPISTSSTLMARHYNSHGCLPSQLHDKFSYLVTNLCEWRDSLARIEDESLGSMLSDNALMALAISCPSTPELICATIAAVDASPQISQVTTHFVSPSSIVEKYLNDLHHVIETSSGGLYNSSLEKQTSETYLDWLVEKVSSLFKSSGTLGNIDKRQSEEWSTDGILAKALEYKIPKRQRLGSAEKSRIQFVKKFSCKAPVYHNCRIYADDGRLLCFCDWKKLDWYVKRGLAEYLEEEPPSVRLLFEPKGRPEYEKTDFYIQSKSNRCVGCGESSHYLRYRIIPSCYRQHFPEHLKSHRSHDIVLLCVDCHEIAHKAAEKHKNQIALDYGVPLFAKVTGTEKMLDGQNKAVVSNEIQGGVSPLQLKNAAMALLRHGPRIPIQRRVELEKVLQTYYGRENILLDDLHSVLLLSMGPQEHRRLLKKGFYKREGGTAGPQGICSEDGIMTKCPSSQSGTAIYFQEHEGQSSKGISEQGISKTSLVSLVQPGDNLKYVDSSVSGEDDVTLPISNEKERDDDGYVVESQSFRRRHPRHKSRKNESLLGHAVHGRRVVEILMEREGDEPILNFCQQWRKVFVDAVHPAYLPLGWDVSHSGRREFGDFSIFKPLEVQ